MTLIYSLKMITTWSKLRLSIAKLFKACYFSFPQLLWLCSQECQITICYDDWIFVIRVHHGTRNNDSGEFLASLMWNFKLNPPVSKLKWWIVLCNVCLQQQPNFQTYTNNHSLVSGTGHSTAQALWYDDLVIAGGVQYRVQYNVIQWQWMTHALTHVYFPHTNSHDIF